MIKGFFNDKSIIFLSIIIFLLIFVRIIILPISLPGLYVDEAIGQSHIIAMVKNKTNANGQLWPLYSQSLGGGFTTPVYLYSASIWSSVFGVSNLALRLFSQFITILSIFFVGLSLKILFDKKTALISIIVGLILPWGWLQGGLAWDPVLVPFMTSLVFLGWSIVFSDKSAKKIIFGKILMLFGFLMMMYAYPPYWVSAPILACFLFLLLYIKKIASFKNILFLFLLAIIFLLPLVNFIIQPMSLSRALELSVFNYDSITEGFLTFFINIFKLINPVFLFFVGDSNLRHATGYQGMLGIGAIIPILFAIWSAFKWAKKRKKFSSIQKEIYFLAVSVISYIACLFGSALTVEGQPHSLRSCAAWVFAVVIITIGWRLIIKHKKRWLIFTAMGILVIGTLFYVVDLSFFYPKRSSTYFGLLINIDYPRQINLL